MGAIPHSVSLPCFLKKDANETVLIHEYNQAFVKSNGQNMRTCPNIVGCTDILPGLNKPMHVGCERVFAHSHTEN
jgi:hypothetical protein